MNKLLLKNNIINQNKLKKYNFNKILNFVNKIYIINLDERKDRLTHTIKELNYYQVKNFQRFSAIKPNFDNIDSKLYEKYSDYLSDNKKQYIVGATGCKLSHLSIIKDALKNNYENILIFEDDITFIDNFTIYLNDFISKVSTMNWDMLYLGGNVAKVKFSKFKDYLIQTNRTNIYKCKNFKCTHAYIINKKLFIKIIKDLETYNSEIDNYYSNCIQPYFNTFTYEFNLVKQRETFSNITQKIDKVF